MRFQRLDDWLSWQESLHFDKIRLGLERVAEVGERLALRPVSYPVITVAGTNGKGSSVTLLETILAAAGYRVGAYTSPHLLRYNERFRIAGQEVSDELLCRAFDRVDQARHEVSLTYFEFGTLAALVLFQEARLDVALLEVGMGGRLDAVNYLDPDLALITTVGLDHTAWLGPDRESIGREKAGILRGAHPAIYADLAPPQSVVQRAQELGTALYRLDHDYRYRVAEGRWSWEGLGRVYDHLPMPALPGAFQLKNAAGALAALVAMAERLPVPEQALRLGLQCAALPGRFHLLHGPVTTVLDVAHNPQAVGVLVQALCAEPCGGRTLAVFSALADKDIETMAATLAGLVQEWHVARLNAERAAPVERIVAAVCHTGAAVRAHEDVAAAYLDARERARVGDRIVVFGSFYTVAAVLGLGL